MAKQIVSDPNTEVDDWLDNDDPNDVGELTAEPGAEDETGAEEPGTEGGGVDSGEEGEAGSGEDEPVTGDDTQEGIVNGSMAYEDLRAQISSGDFKLQAMLDKLTRLYIDDMLTEDEYDVLMQLARDNANPDVEIVENADIIKQLMQRVTESEQKLKDLEALIVKLEDPETEPEEPVVTYEPYDPHKWYYKDMTCSFEGKNYICIAPEGVVCTWSPAGYPSYWKLVK